MNSALLRNAAWCVKHRITISHAENVLMRSLGFSMCSEVEYFHVPEVDAKIKAWSEIPAEDENARRRFAEEQVTAVALIEEVKYAMKRAVSRAHSEITDMQQIICVEGSTGGGPSARA